jgi:hypothetical protein
MMGQTRLPKSLQQFVARQTAMPVMDLRRSPLNDQLSPYGSYWCRAVPRTLL